MGFTKLDQGILQSSIMAEPPEVFKVFVAILASTGPDGIARVSSTFLAAACFFPLDAVDKALLILESPDPRSRSLNDDGRRIRRVDGGYFVINYEKYRSFCPQPGDPESPGAIRTRRWREKKDQDVTVTSQNHRDVSSASASASVSLEDLEKEFARFYDGYDYKVSKDDARDAFKALRRKGIQEKEIIAAVNGYLAFLKMKKDQDHFEQSKMYPATFLRKNRWRDYVGIVYKPL